MRKRWRASVPMQRRARTLRLALTSEEQLLWAHLAGRQMLGAYFRRQVPMGGYVLDFYCARAKLAIEVDGAGHERQVVYDKERTQWLSEENNICLLRFANCDVRENLPSVLQQIQQALARR